MVEMVTISTKGQVVSDESDESVSRKPNRTIWELAGSIKGRGFSIKAEKEAAIEEAVQHTLGVGLYDFEK